MNSHIKELFKPLPSSRYLLVGRDVDEFANILDEILNSVGATLYKELVLPRLKPREFDMVILKDSFWCADNKKDILKQIYSSLANGAYIVLLEKKSLLNIYEIKELLQEYEYRAANEIDMLDGYDLIIAKKLHMWGNGL